jgi:lipoyl(octanoyl) transferase
MLDLEKRGKDIRRFVYSLEQWMIHALARCGVEAHRSPGRIGIWVGAGKDEAKIGALGVRVKRWVTLHGFSLNVDPDLGHFTGIVPCGIKDFGVASLASLGKHGSMADLDGALRQSFGEFLADLQASCKES